MLGNPRRLRQHIGKLGRAHQNRVSLAQAVIGQEIVGPAAGLFDKKEPSKDIPGIDVELAIGVGASVGDVGDAKRSRARLRTVACLLGGAVGDALGAPVASMTIQEIRRHHGQAGIDGL